jgi:hypothetical protein
LYADMQVFEFTASSMCIGYRNSVLYWRGKNVERL